MLSLKPRCCTIQSWKCTHLASPPEAASGLMINIPQQNGPGSSEILLVWGMTSSNISLTRRTFAVMRVTIDSEYLVTFAKQSKNNPENVTKYVSLWETKKIFFWVIILTSWENLTLVFEFWGYVNPHPPHTSLTNLDTYIRSPQPFIPQRTKSAQLQYPHSFKFSKSEYVVPRVPSSFFFTWKIDMLRTLQVLSIYVLCRFYITTMLLHYFPQKWISVRLWPEFEGSKTEYRYKEVSAISKFSIVVMKLLIDP